MRYVIYLLLFTTSTTFCNDLDTVKYGVPPVIFDSLVYETMKGRACSKALDAQTEATVKLQTELLAQGKIINLQKQEATHLDEIIAAMQQQYNAKKTITNDRIHKLKVKIRKLTVLLIGETGIIILVVILLL